MDLHRRKLWGDRLTWLLVAAATVVIVWQYVTKGGELRSYLLYGWSAVVFLLLLSELRVGRRNPDAGPRALHAGWAKLVGIESVDGVGERRVGWTGAASGLLRFMPYGVEWASRRDQPGPRELIVSWPELHGWRLHGVVPLVWRASGYLTFTRTDGEDLVFHVQGTRRWRKALREAAIVGPTFVRPEWLPDESAAEFPELLAEVIAAQDTAVIVPEIAPPTFRTVPPPPIERPPAAREPEAAVAQAAAPPAPAAGPATAPSDEPAPAAGPATAPSDEPAPAAGPAAAADAPAAPPDTEPEAPVPDLEPVIGLECHVELSTASKVFCGCPTGFGAAPNTQICPVCTGQPGTLPVLNERAVEFALKIGLALNCEIAPRSIFHRKNYFYPDMPKNYQISQYDVPLATNGWIEIEVDGSTRRIGIHRVHLEEDTGKTSHVGGTGRIAEAEYSLVDYNRAGVPLVEVVSEPDIRTPAEARVYLQELRALLESLGVSDVRMEQGSLRCDANVSVRPAGSAELGTKAEVKNMNSVRSVQRALEFEIKRQSEVLGSGGTVVQETRHFDEGSGRTSSMRSKEYAFDYRYFPEPDLLPVAPDPAWIDRLRTGLPELPAQRRRRFVAGFGLTEDDARTITSSARLADAFEEAVRAYGGPGTAIARWYTGELAAIGNERHVEAHEIGVTPSAVAELQQLVDSGRVSLSVAKGTILKEVVQTGKHPADVLRESGLTQISDEDELARIVEEVLAENADIVQKIRDGKGGAIGALIAEVKRKTEGRADLAAVNALLREKIEA